MEDAKRLERGEGFPLLKRLSKEGYLPASRSDGDLYHGPKFFELCPVAKGYLVVEVLHLLRLHCNDQRIGNGLRSAITGPTPSCVVVDVEVDLIRPISSSMKEEPNLVAEFFSPQEPRNNERAFREA